MAYNSVFGGNTIYPSDVTYLALALTANTELEWPLEASGDLDPLARILDVTPSAGGYSITLPDATQASPGQTVLFNNTSGSYSFTVKDNAGGTVATVAYGTQWQVYLTGVATAAGTWEAFQFGASTATVQASALAGYGLTVSGTALSQALSVTTFSTTGLTIASSNRGDLWAWTGSGAGTLNLPVAAGVGNNFFFQVRNSGGGDLTIDPAGSETIDDASTLVLSPDESCIITTDGAEWYTVGLGREATFAFDYTSIAVTGGTYTLSGSELNRIAYKFTGILTSNCVVVVPATVQQYWINNATTGAYTLSFKISGGAATTVDQNAKSIYYCDGTSVIRAADASSITTPVAVADGGTGATTASAARLNIGISTFADAIVTDTTAAGVRTTISAAAQGANADITSLTGLTTPLSAAQGGTGSASYTTGDIIYASGATALSKLAGVATGNVLLSGGVGAAPAWGKVGLTTHVSGTLATGNGGTGVATASNGQLLIGNGSGFTAATLTAGTGIGITNGAGTISIAVTSSLTNWTEAVNTSAPNGTIPAVSFTATNAAASVDAVLAPKGASGAVMAAVPDNTATGGNKRGAQAVDWQRDRGAATQVASGTNSVVAGGTNNTASGLRAAVSGGNTNIASGPYSAVVGGINNTASGTGATVGGSASTASGDYSFAAGGTCTASGSYSFAAGRENTASSGYAIALGYFNTASTGLYAVAIGVSHTVTGTAAAAVGGQNNTASGPYSTALGYLATTRGLHGMQANAAGNFVTAGDAQRGVYVGRISTTNATVTELTLDGGAGSASTRVVLPNDSTYVFDILIVARRTDADNESAGYNVTGVIDRQTNAASTALVGSVTKTVLGEDTAAWDVTVDADTTNGSLRIRVTGEAAKTIRWVAVVNTVEVVG